MKKIKIPNRIVKIVILIVLLIVVIIGVGKIINSKDKHVKNNNTAGDEIDLFLEDKNILNQYENKKNNEKKNYLGKYVKYDANGNGSVKDDKILWRVLRSEDDKVELITADTWGNIALTPTDFEDARNQYNNIVTEIVQKCIDVTEITSVRSVGGPVIDTTGNVLFKNIISFNPEEGKEFSKYEGENGFKVGDDYYLEDYEQMIKAGVAQADNLQEYWFASRDMRIISENVCFGVRSSDSVNIDKDTSLCYVKKDATSEYTQVITSRGIRPVLTLKGGILEGKPGIGTKKQPIEIY